MGDDWKTSLEYAVVQGVSRYERKSCRCRVVALGPSPVPFHLTHPASYIHKLILESKCFAQTYPRLSRHFLLDVPQAPHTQKYRDGNTGQNVSYPASRSRPCQHWLFLLDASSSYKIPLPSQSVKPETSEPFHVRIATEKWFRVFHSLVFHLTISFTASLLLPWLRPLPPLPWTPCSPFALPASTVMPSDLFSTEYNINRSAQNTHFVSLVHETLGWRPNSCGIKLNPRMTHNVAPTCIPPQPCPALCPSHRNNWLFTDGGRRPSASVRFLRLRLFSWIHLLYFVCQANTVRFTSETPPW